MFDHDSGHFIGEIFWLFIILVTVVPLFLRFRSRMETEKTIRLAIEKGQQLDPKTIETLLSASCGPLGYRGYRGYYGRHGMRTREEMRATGMICIGTGVGLYLFGYLSPIGILMGVGPLVLCIGVAMMAGSFFLPPTTPDDRSDRNV